MAVKFGKYILLNKVATGGMAEVFKAKHIGVGGFEKIVAIKRILPHFSNNEEFITMFNEEAKVSAQLSHQNIVQIYDFGMIDQSYYIAMEYVDGVNLNDLLIKYAEEDTVIPKYITLGIIRDVNKGLNYAHLKKGFDNKALNIVHRDISPKNIMISFDGAVKVMDFGIAKAASRDYETRTGVIKGKISYLSPEQVQGARLDQRSDIFSLGIVFYEALTGMKCFKGESDFSILFKIKNAEIEPVTEINAEIEPEIEEIVLKSLAQDRDKRYQTCEDFASDIDKFLSSKNLDPSATNLSSLMHSLETDLRAMGSVLEEYFPDQGEEVQGEVFKLGEDGQIPEEIGTKIAEESIRHEGSYDVTPSSPDGYGTKVVDAPVLLSQAKSSSLTWLLPVLVVLVMLLGAAGYLYYSGILTFGNTQFSNTSTSNNSSALPNKTPIVNQGTNNREKISYKIEIKTQPDGASVIVNGVKHKKLTPMTLKGYGFSESKITLTVSKKCYNAVNQILILKKGKLPRHINFELKKMIINVSLSSLPQGATLFLDRKKLGITPITLNEMDACTPHSLKLIKDKYETLTKSKVFFKTHSINYSLLRKKIPGYVLFKSSYPVTIVRGSKKLGEVSENGLKLKLAKGNYNFTAISEKYCIRKNFSITIKENKTVNHSLNFGPIGKVRIIAIPYADVTVNGFSLGTTPIQKVELPEGVYTVVWNFVNQGKKKTERLKITRNIRQEWRGSLHLNDSSR